MKYIFVLLMATINMTIVQGQAAEDSVKTIVNKLFDAMRNADTELLKSVFSETAILQTIGTGQDGAATIKNEAPSEFIDFVSKLAKGVADERIIFETIRIDGPLALVWAPYKFFYKGTFSHCGVDSFQLVRMNGGWKIQYIIDTRRKTGCE